MPGDTVTTDDAADAAAAGVVLYESDSGRESDFGDGFGEYGRIRILGWIVDDDEVGPGAGLWRGCGSVAGPLVEAEALADGGGACGFVVRVGSVGGCGCWVVGGVFGSF